MLNGDMGSTQEKITKLEEDEVNILQFMASNDLVAYAAKTEFMILNDNEKMKRSGVMKQVP